MKTVLTRWSGLEITQVGSLITIVGAIPAIWHYAHRAWNDWYRCVRQLFLASVTIAGGDPVNKAVIQWIQNNRPRHHRVFAARTESHGDHTDRAAALKKSQLAVQYSPYWVSRWFLYGGSLFITTRALDGPSTMLGNASYDGGFGGEELTISCFGWSVEPIKALITECRDYAEKQAQYFVIIYSRDRYGLSWKPKARTPIRHLESVYFDDVAKEALITDIRTYLHPSTRKKYQKRSMPYRRGYLFYGPPGTGKTSLTTALAGEFGLDLYEVKVPSVATDADLEQMFEEIPPKCIILLEDIDAVWTKRAPSTRASSRNGNEESPHRSNCTLSGLLNVLDGVGSQEGRIAIMTTNQPELLDSALIRPGRVDMRVCMGNISKTSARQMFLHMFAPGHGDLEPSMLPDGSGIYKLADRFAAVVPENTFTPSQLQGFFQKHLDDPEDAASSIDSWVKEEISNMEREFEIVTEKRENLV